MEDTEYRYLNDEKIYKIYDTGKITYIKAKKEKQVDAIFDKTTKEYGQLKGKQPAIIMGHIDKGYHVYGLNDKNTGKCITMRGHRLVASVFLKNPNKYDVVHHKDGNKSNNHKDNLEWTTQSQNAIYSVGKKVDKYSKDNKFICTYDSVIEAMNENKMKSNHIHDVCDGNRETTGGFKWKWHDEE